MTAGSVSGDATPRVDLMNAISGPLLMHARCVSKLVMRAFVCVRACACEISACVCLRIMHGLCGIIGGGGT